jgi:hypothetical protein
MATAAMTASARPLAPNLRYRFVMWRSTVPRVIPNVVAICLFDEPPATSRSTSCSHSLAAVVDAYP